MIGQRFTPPGPSSLQMTQRSVLLLGLGLLLGLLLGLGLGSEGGQGWVHMSVPLLSNINTWNRPSTSHEAELQEPSEKLLGAKEVIRFKSITRVKAVSSQFCLV